MRYGPLKTTNKSSKLLSWATLFSVHGRSESWCQLPQIPKVDWLKFSNYYNTLSGLFYCCIFYLLRGVAPGEISPELILNLNNLYQRMNSIYLNLLLIFTQLLPLSLRCYRYFLVPPPHTSDSIAKDSTSTLLYDVCG